VQEVNDILLNSQIIETTIQFDNRGEIEEHTNDAVGILE